MKLPHVIIVASTLLLAACKFVATGSESKDGGGNSGTVSPEQQVGAMWDAKVLPYLEKKAGDFKAVRDAVEADADIAGAAYGYREKQSSSPWTVVVRLDGKIVAANTVSRAGSIDVDADGDGNADARVQIGPVMRGTALRDSLDFVSFNQFTNQIDFAQFGKAFNLHVDETVTSKLPRDQLIGKNVRILGAYPLAGGSDLPLVTPAKIKLQ
jgi:predicted lipoprotein